MSRQERRRMERESKKVNETKFNYVAVNVSSVPVIIKGKKVENNLTTTLEQMAKTTAYAANMVAENVIQFVSTKLSEEQLYEVAMSSMMDDDKTLYEVLVRNCGESFANKMMKVNGWA